MYMNILTHFIIYYCKEVKENDKNWNSRKFK